MSGSGMELVPPSSRQSGKDTGWDFPQDGIWFSAPDKEALVQKVIAYREANNLPVGNASQEVTDFNDAKIRQVTPVAIDVSFRARIIKWLDMHLRERPQFVDQDVADKRAAICAQCPHNIVNWKAGEKCKNCVENANRATAIILQGRKQHPGVGACGALLQNNTAAVYLDEPPVKDESLPSFCWRRQV